MRNNPYLFTLMFSAVILVIDLYTYRGVKKLTDRYSRRIRFVVRLLFWVIPAVLIIGLMLFAMFGTAIHPSQFLPYFHLISGTFILFYIPKLLFVVVNLIDDLILLFKKIFKTTKVQPEANGEPISRARFLSRVGMVAAGVPFLAIAYGITWGRFNYTVREHVLTFPHLPDSFEGLRIVQISDFHIGSFLNNRSKVDEAIGLINELNADLLLFTGDLVNNVSAEMDQFLPMFARLKSTMGKFSVLGNHDYGDYVPWRSKEAKRQNLERLVAMQQSAGFTVLLNESRSIERNGDSIELLVVENWGLPPFPQYGDLGKAMSTTNPGAFKILMSHDPTHWDARVLAQTAIDLTLSGHTHGAQFGIEIPGWRWSPVSVRYKRWGGLYREGNQVLNVNTGIGFIGFPGRVGIPPEVTLIKLRRGA